MGVKPEETTEDQPVRAPVAGAGQALAAFYDRRAPAALAYCARLCRPEAIADAVEESFAYVFSEAAGGGALDEETLDRRLRAAVRSAAADRAPRTGDGYCDEVRHLLAARAEGELSDPERERLATHLRGCEDCRERDSRFVEAERAYDALSGDDAPALGRSLLGQVIAATPERDGDWLDLGELDWGSRAAAPAGDEPAATATDDTAATPPPEPATATEAPAPGRRPHLPRVAPGWRRRIAIVLGVAGVLLLAEGAVTFLWKEPFTGYLAAQAQDDLSKQLDKLDHQRVGLAANDERSVAAIGDATARARKRMSLLAARLDSGVPEGEALGRLQIDKLGVDYVFVQGTAGASLRKGPGHYHPATTLPGQGGTVGIAGHRTTYEAPFRDVDQLKAGDKIVLRMPYGRFTYAVTGHRIVPADYGQAFTSGGGERLVLSACHPRYSATERILVDAGLVASEPLGAAVEPTLPAVPADSPKLIAQRRTAARLKLLGTRQLGPGTTGPDVSELQRLLGMPATGTFDANTTAAVLAFQRDHGLPQVGHAGSQTKLALARRAHPPSRPPTPATVPQQSTQPNGGGQYPGQTGGTYTGPTQSPSSTGRRGSGTGR